MECQQGSSGTEGLIFDNHQYDHISHSKTSISRRSVDWRDSGIVIDDDQQQQFFNSMDKICSDSNVQSNYSQLTSNSSLFEHDDDGDTVLHLAVVGCSINKVRDLISICDLNAINNMMQTPLHVATMANRPEMVELLLLSGAKFDIQDRRGNTPLHIACQKGFTRVASVILDYLSKNQSSLRQYIEVTDFDGQTCLHSAASHNQKEIIELLVNSYNIDLNFRDTRSGETIIHKAISLFDVGLLEFILKLGKHCNQADYYGRKPLDTIKILKESKIDKQQYDNLITAEQLICNEIKKCVEQDGCCVLTGYNKQILNPSSPSSSSSSSDYSDSDSDS